MSALPVTQAHRDAAAEMHSTNEESWSRLCDQLVAGGWDSHPYVQAFARFERDILTRPTPPTGEVEALREALAKAATRFEICAGMIAESHSVSGTRRAERTIKAKQFALEACTALKETQP
jgi:hypothetical protein